MSGTVANFLAALIGAVIIAVAKELIPYLAEARRKAMVELRGSKWAWAADIVESVVRAVEQTLSEELHGRDKKKAAVSWIKEILSSNGISLSDQQIDTLVEAAVQAMNEGRGPIDSGREVV